MAFFRKNSDRGLFFHTLKKKFFLFPSVFWAFPKDFLTFLHDVLCYFVFLCFCVHAVCCFVCCIIVIIVSVFGCFSVDVFWSVVIIFSVFFVFFWYWRVVLRERRLSWKNKRFAWYCHQKLRVGTFRNWLFVVVFRWLSLLFVWWFRCCFLECFLLFSWMLFCFVFFVFSDVFFCDSVLLFCRWLSSTLLDKLCELFK